MGSRLNFAGTDASTLPVYTQTGCRPRTSTKLQFILEEDRCGRCVFPPYARKDVATVAIHPTPTSHPTSVWFHGRPPEQKVQIPFVDFLLTSYGYVQNEQSEFNARSIRTFGVLLADQIDGEFKLDIRAIRAITMKKLVTNHEAE